MTEFVVFAVAVFVLGWLAVCWHFGIGARGSGSFGGDGSYDGGGGFDGGGSGGDGGGGTGG